MKKISSYLILFTLILGIILCDSSTSVIQGDSSSVYSGNTQPDVIWVPTPQGVVDKMLAMAQVKKGDLVYDLGCGDGRIVVTAAKKYGARAVGFDVDPERIKNSEDNVKRNGLDKLVSIRQKDIFTLDLSKADVITLYLLPNLNVKLIPQLKKCRPGTRIVSHDFDMRGIKPNKVVHLDGSVVFLWITPLVEE